MAVASRRPSVSIGMPVYNGETYLESTVESVLAQTFDDIEVIIVDNASTDGTETIARSLSARDTRVRYSRNPENVGVVRNYRRARSEATGRYFKWLAFDDPLHPAYLDKMVGLLEEHPEASIATSRMPLIDEEDAPVPFDKENGTYTTDYGETHRWIDAPPDLSSPVPHVRFATVVHRMTSNLTTECFYGLARMSFLETTKPFGLFLGGDKVLIGELALRGPIRHLPEDLFFRRMHPAHFGGRELRQVVEGLDPERRGRFAFPAGRELVAYADAVSRSPLSWGEKARCLGVLGSKVASPDTLKKVLLPGPNNYFGWGFKRPS